MKITLIVILLCYLGRGFTQNLISNGGFEKRTMCPFTLGDFYIEDWHSTLHGRKTPDYFSLCSNKETYSSPNNYLVNVQPFMGEAYAGLVGYNPHNGYREYITTILVDSLVKGEEYIFSIALSQPELSLYFINNLGVVFSNDSLDVKRLPNSLITSANINIQVPDGFLQCRNTWTEYAFNYTAIGGEKYLHLGCFLTDEKLLYRTYQDRRDFCNKTGYKDAYYLIDEVSLRLKRDSLLSDVEKIQTLENAIPFKTFVFDDINFETGDFSSDSKAFEQFDELIAFLRDNPDKTVLVEGHTDDVGSTDDNLTLSNERALFVKSFFMSKEIVNKIYAKGFGEENPVKPNDSSENRRKNRRVVVKVF
jgi:outer membrane protein OmpA-like peptidoglycan-associated protein